ncbi:MAG: nitrogen fixation protein NifQ [Rhodospirillaceae bacterium]|nr:nitrogen fixation protein NifQ [Rhodospirillaceae bacterium]
MSGQPSAYGRLMEAGTGDPFDRHVFACAVAIGLGEAPTPLTAALGLSIDDLVAVFAAYFPRAVPMLADLPPDDATTDAPEEPDLRALLLDHRSEGAPAETALAAIVARRSCRSNHLWQDMGLFDRKELNRLLHRHFRPLAAQNINDMKWKKFFYRKLCEQDGLLVCRSPNCDVCADKAHCFGPETGDRLTWG